jgi:DNA-binding SARP family transcriptional activator
VVDRLRIHLLGPFELWLDGQMLAPDAWPGRKARQLFKILVTYRERMVASDELLEWLWPDLTPGSARNSLWVAVSRLRRLLEPGAAGRGASSFVVTEASGYRFYAGNSCEIDVDRFSDHARQGWTCQREGAWVEAIEAFNAAGALYRGDYLAEDPYEDWAHPMRELLRENFLELEGALAACHLALGRSQEALAHAREVLGHDPCRESAWRLVMEAHYRAGEQDQALRAFERCRAVLAHELGVDPLPETAALHERMLRAPPSLPRQSSSPLPAALALQLPFVGRDHEWTRLADLLRRAMDGQGRVVLVSGEPGIGKTRLLEELAGLATARGAQILAGQCYELEQNVAYAPIVEALRGLLPALLASPPACPPGQLAAVAELLPELRGIGLDLPPYRPLPPDEERTRLLTSLAQVIRRCAQREPVVLLIDDLQWADPSTLQLVHYLGRQVGSQPLLLAGAFRSTRIDPRHPLTALRDQLSRLGVLEELSLPAFQEEDVVLLLRILGSQDVGNSLARQLYGKTEGHPYFLAEVLRTLAQEKRIVADAEGSWHFVEEAQTSLDEQWPLPPSVRRPCSDWIACRRMSGCW